MKKILLLSCMLLLLFIAKAQPTSGTSMTTDGSTQFASTPNGMMEGLTNFTIETWIKTTENKSSGTYWQKPSIIGNARGANADNDFGITTSGGLVGMWTGMATENAIESAVAINDNLWHHVAAVKNGAVLTLFVDGINSGTIAVGAGVGPTTSDAPLTLGGSAHNGNFGVGENAALVSTFHQGEFAETRFSSNARYSANFTPAGSFTTDANTVALYHYGACQKIIATDASANANFLSGRFAAPTCATGLPFTKAINYNGVDQSAFLPDGVMNGLTNFTMEGWIKTTDIGTAADGLLFDAPVIFSKDNPAGASGDIMLNTQAGFLSFTYEGQGNGYTSEVGKSFIADNNWHHWAVSADGVNVRYFADGILQGSKAVGGGITVGAGEKFALMGDGNPSGYTAKAHTGFLEEVRFSNIARYTASFTPPTAAFTNNAATVALYHSNDCPGTNTLTDASSNGNNATLNNFGGSCDGLTVTKPGSGNAMSFDGVDDYVRMPSSTYTAYTIETWVKFNGANTIDQNIAGFTAGDPFSSVSHQIRTDASGHFVHYSYDGTGHFIASTTVAVTNKYYHIAITAANNGQMKLFVNGIEEGTAINIGTLWTGGVEFRFGSGSIGIIGLNNASPLNGNMDEVKLWNTALTEAQIRDRMCRKIESTDPLYANLLAYYNFDETAGNTCYNKVNETSGYAFLTNGPVRLTSSAPIGNTSANSYAGATAAATLTNTPRGDAFTATLTAGGADGIQVFSVNQAPNISTGVTGIGDNNAYFGTFVVNGTNPAYRAVYNYTGVTITDKSDIHLFKRTDNATTTWTDAAATNNTTAKTLTATGQHTEYILGSTGVAGIVTTVANLTPCKGSIIPVSFVPSGVLQAGNTFTAQLSNASGSFAAPVAIGSIAITAASIAPYSISVTIPANTIDGTAYRIRIVSSLPAITGAANTGNITITTPATPTVTAGGVTTFCQGGNVVLTSSATSGNVWSNGATTKSITVNASGNYTVSATNANGCTSAASLATTVTVNPLPAKPIISAGSATTFCQGGSVTLTSSIATGNVWSNGATTQSITVNTSGSYSITRTNANGCSITSAATIVTVNANPVANTTPTGTINIVSPNTVNISANGTFSSYLWSNGATTQSITVGTTGSYSVTVTNASGCTGTSAPVVVNVRPSIPTISIANKSINEGNSDTTAMVFVITLNHAYDSTVTIRYKTVNKTATAGSDYVLVNKLLNFTAGQVRKNVTIKVIGDVTVEPNEQFNVALINPVNTILGSDTAIGTIINDDAASFAAITKAGNSLKNITVMLSPNPSKDVLNITGLRAEKNNIIITDLQGKLLVKQIVSGSRATVNISNLAQGMYMLGYFDGSIYKTLKFIKE